MEELYSMALHDIVVINRKVRVLRVPGGWIYERVTKKLSDTDNEVFVVFVPYNDEFNAQV